MLRKLTLFLTVVLLTLAGCERAPRDGAANDATVVQARVRPAPMEGGFVTLAEDYATTGLTVRLRWPSHLGLPRDMPVLAFVLPAGVKPAAAWRDVHYGGAPWPPADELTTGSLAARYPGSPATPEFVGYLRRWPIYSLQVTADIFAPLQDGSDGQTGAPAPADDLELTLSLSWRAPDAPTQEPSAADPAAKDAPSNASWRDLAARLVANPEGLSRYAVASPPPPEGERHELVDPREHAPSATRWSKLLVREEGLIHLPMEELIKAGVPSAEAVPSAVRVFSRGRPVPLLVAPGPAVPSGWPAGVYFWATGGKTPYSRERAYWVTTDDSVAAALLARAPADAEPTTAALATIPRKYTYEQDNSLEMSHGSFLAVEAMEWIDAPLEPEQPLQLRVELPHFAGGGALSGLLKFFLDTDRTLSQVRAEVEINRNPVATLKFYGARDATKQIDLPATAFADGAATLTITLYDERSPTEREEAPVLVWFDHLAITYPSQPRLLDGRLTIPGDALTSVATRAPILDAAGNPAPAAIALRIVGGGEAESYLPVQRDRDGTTYVTWVRPRTMGAMPPEERIEIVTPEAARPVTNLRPLTFPDLRTPDEPLDLLIVTHAEFEEAARRLAEFHDGRGWRTRVIDVEGVYDLFSHGTLDPGAIRGLLGHLLRAWGARAPGHVLLIGDCNSDYLDVARKGVRNWIPTYTFENGAERWASDFWFTAVAGSDDLPDFMLGRLSVANRDDARRVVDKIIQYGRRAMPGPWRARLGYVADNGEFTEVIDSLRREETPRQFTAERVYLDELPFEDNWYLPQTMVERKRMKVSRAATDRILALFRGGVSYLTYYGHGSPNIWADERIWFGGDSPNSDNLHLADSGWMTFVANMTCNSGAIDYPVPPWNICITEDMMRVENGGAIACYVPSGPGITSIHRRMSQALRRVLLREGVRQFGEIVTLAKARYALNRDPRELLYMYLLLGDPTLDLQLVDELRELQLSRNVVAPGTNLTVELEGLEPREGRWTGELTSADGASLWTADEATYRGGALTLRLDIPSTAPEGAAELRLYAWSPAGGAEMAAAGTIEIEYPELALDRLRVDPSAAPPAAIATVRNPAKINSTGRLELLAEDGATTRVVLTRELSLAPGANLEVSAALPASPDRPLIARAILHAARPHADPGQPLQFEQQVLASVPAGWTGWLPTLAAWSFDRPGLPSELHVVAATREEPPPRLLARVLTAAGDTVGTQTLGYGAAAAGGMDTASTAEAALAEATFTLSRDLVERLAEGALWLGRLTTETLTLEEVDRVPLALIPRRAADVRIVPGSARVRPPNPTEGETVFVDLLVENVGNIPSAPMMVSLLDKPPDAGGQPLPNQIEYNRDR
ncbi:MAG TPA: C25 family cysteine peptidase, partial [Candidatus Sumerlaeota bacterium]|nr:C25 family cysteine peptidase [Candidatus Sumerlaeota bacterium]